MSISGINISSYYNNSYKAGSVSDNEQLSGVQEAAVTQEETGAGLTAGGDNAQQQTPAPAHSDPIASTAARDWGFLWYGRSPISMAAPFGWRKARTRARPSRWGCQRNNQRSPKTLLFVFRRFACRPFPFLAVRCGQPEREASLFNFKLLAACFRVIARQLADGRVFAAVSKQPLLQVGVVGADMD